MFIFEIIRTVFAVIESVILCTGVLFTAGQFTLPGDYFAKLNGIQVYDNRAQDALPSTVVYDVVLDHFTAERTDGKTPKCLIIGYDGARADALAHAGKNAKSGILALKADGGVVYNMYVGGNMPRTQRTDTAPGWASMLTGQWAVEKDGGGNGVTGNGVPKAVEPKTLFTQLLERDLAAQTAFVVSWGGHFTADDATYQHEIAYTQAEELNVRWLKADNDAGTYAQTLAQVQDPDAGMVMCILEHCDGAGHGSGYGSYNDNYVEAFQASEGDAYNLIQAVKARPSYETEDWLILITSDHGGVFTGHGTHFAEVRQVFLASNKPLTIDNYERNWFIF